MSRSVLRAAGPYRIVFSVQAWQAVGRMPSTSFDAVRAAVDALAEDSARRKADELVQPEPLFIPVGDMRVTYARNYVERTLTIPQH